MSSNMQLRAEVIETVRAYCEAQGVSTYIWVQLDDACIVPHDRYTLQLLFKKHQTQYFLSGASAPRSTIMIHYSLLLILFFAPNS